MWRPAKPNPRLVLLLRRAHHRGHSPRAPSGHRRRLATFNYTATQRGLVASSMGDGELLCDFCSISMEPNTGWRLPAESFSYGPPGIPPQRSVGDWGACDECAQLIIADDKLKLLARGLRGTGLPEHKQAALRPFIQSLHKGFFKHWSNDIQPMLITEDNHGKSIYVPPLGAPGHGLPPAHIRVLFGDGNTRFVSQCLTCQKKFDEPGPGLSVANYATHYEEKHLS